MVIKSALGGWLEGIKLAHSNETETFSDYMG